MSSTPCWENRKVNWLDIEGFHDTNHFRVPSSHKDLEYRIRQLTRSDSSLEEVADDGVGNGDEGGDMVDVEDSSRDGQVEKRGRIP